MFINDNWRTHRFRTQSLHREPPYARCTDLMRFETVAYWRGRRAGMPGSAMPQSPHLGAVPGFLRWWYTSRPPGVFTTRRLFDVVLYGVRLRIVTRWAISVGYYERLLVLWFRVLSAIGVV